MPAQIDIPIKEIADFCRRHGIRRLALFGSVLRDDFRPDSDVDFLVEFQPDAIPSYIGLADMQFELKNLLGREVDLRTLAEMGRHFRDKVVRNAEVVYAADG